MLRCPARLFLRGLILAVVLAGAGPDGEAAAPLPPDEALRAFELARGFRIELVAAEPLVVDPVAIAWDARGRMLVVEMHDYPVSAPGGRIVYLLDTDGDGKLDTRRVFADGLAYPSSALPWRDGILVTSAPHVWYLRDRDGDLQADERRVVVTGFGEGNPQLRVNGLRFGPDNWIWLANGRSGGQVRFPDQPASRAAKLGRFDLRLNLVRGQIAPENGPSQFGQTFDWQGNRFLSYNTIHIRHDVLAKRYLDRNPLLASSSGLAHIADHGDAGRVYPLAPPGPRFNREPPGYFNASCGIEADRGSLFQPPYSSSVYVCEPLFNLVHRDELVPASPTFVARRGAGEETREFLRSRDPWFRPVNLRFGPDGALYVVDFYREWIEHPQFVPPSVRDTIPYRRGDDRGRIWRIVPADAELQQAPDLSTASTDELLRELCHRFGWRRETARRLLIERGTDALSEDVVARLERQAVGAASVWGRLETLRTLEGCGVLREAVLLRALHDPAEPVRRQAVLLCEPLLKESRAVRRALIELAEDPSTTVRFQLICTLGWLQGDEVERALLLAARQELNNPWVRKALLSASSGRSARFLGALIGSQPPAPRRDAGELELLEKLAMAGVMEGATGGVVEAIRAALRDGRNEAAIAATVGMARSLRRGDKNPNDGLQAALGKGTLSELRRAALGIVVTGSNGVAAEAAYAVRLLGEIGTPEDRKELASLFGANTPLGVQRALVEALANHPKELAQAIARWNELSPAIRSQVLLQGIRHPAFVEAVLKGVESGEVSAAELRSVLQRIGLEAVPAEYRARIEPILRPRGGKLALQRWLGALREPGDPERGRAVFMEHCSGCHRVRGAGSSVGPDLSGLVAWSPERIALEVLDPDRQIMPGFMGYVVLTRDGRIYTGLVRSETDRGIVLRAQGGEDVVLDRSEIEAFRSTGRSLMPENFSELLTPAQLRDLIAFLRQP